MPKNATVKAGATKLFACLATDATETAWFKNGAPLQSDGRVRVLVNNYLLLAAVEGDDEGMYACVVRSSTLNCERRAQAYLSVYQETTEGK